MLQVSQFPSASKTELILLAQYAIRVCNKAVFDSLSMKNIIFSLQNRIIQWKNYMYVKLHRSLYNNEIPCQAVCHKMALYPIQDELKDLKNQKKFLICQNILFKKKAKFSKTKGSICKVHIEAANIWNIFYQGQQFPMD